MINLISILTLVVPSVSWKLYRDRNGVKHPDYEGVAEVLVLWMLGFIFVAFFKYPHVASPYVLLLQCLAVSFCGHGFLFTYGFNIIWYIKTIKPIREEYRTYIGRPASSPFLFIVNHLSDKAIPDSWPFWRSLGWAGRLIVYVVIFTAACLWLCL